MGRGEGVRVAGRWAEERGTGEDGEGERGAEGEGKARVGGGSKRAWVQPTPGLVTGRQTAPVQGWWRAGATQRPEERAGGRGVHSATAGAGAGAPLAQPASRSLQLKP